MMFENDGKKQEIDNHFWTVDEDIAGIQTIASRCRSIYRWFCNR